MHDLFYYKMHDIQFNDLYYYKYITSIRYVSQIHVHIMRTAHTIFITSIITMICARNYAIDSVVVYRYITSMIWLVGYYISI